MNHEELKSQLMGAAMQPFIKSLFDRLHVDRGGTLYNSFEEVSLRRPLAGGQNRTSRADVVTFISTGVCAHALYKASEMPNVGVFDIQRGIIVKMPEPQTIVPSYYMELLEQVTYCQRRNSGKRNTAVDA